MERKARSENFNPGFSSNSNLTSAFSPVSLSMVSILTTLVGEFSVMLMVRIRVNL